MTPRVLNKRTMTTSDARQEPHLLLRAQALSLRCSSAKGQCPMTAARPTLHAMALSALLLALAVIGGLELGGV